MNVIKKYVMFSVLLLFYVSIVSILILQVVLYQNSYEKLSMQISHTSIEAKAMEAKATEEE